MFFLEVLDEFYDDIERSYGDYGQIVNNWIVPTRNIHYIMHYILKKYYSMGYYPEADQCARSLIHAFQSHQIDMDYGTYINILEIWYLANAQCDHIGPHIATTIVGWCEANPLLKAEYMKNTEYYDGIFGITSQFA
jgi:hypothetical protein